MLATNLFKTLHVLVMFGLKIFGSELQVLSVLIFVQLFFLLLLYYNYISVVNEYIVSEHKLSDTDRI